MTSAIEQARKNAAHAEQYLKTMIEARQEAEYREKVARQLLKEAQDTLARHPAPRATEATPQESS